MLILLSKMVSNTSTSFSVFFIKKSINMKLLFFQSKCFVFLHLIYKPIRLSKIASKSLRKKKNLQINMLFIKEYKNTYQYSRYVKQNSLKNHFLTWDQRHWWCYNSESALEKNHGRDEHQHRSSRGFNVNFLVPISMPLSLCFSLSCSVLTMKTFFSAH